MLKQLKLQAAKLLLKLAEITTDNGVLICDGEIAVGKEVFIVDADGEYVIAPDATYTETLEGETVNTYVVLDGVVSEIVLAEVETPVEAPVEEELEIENEINILISEMMAVIEALTERVIALENKGGETSTTVEELSKLVGRIDKKSLAFSAEELLKEKQTDKKSKGDLMAEAFRTLKNK